MIDIIIGEWVVEDGGIRHKIKDWYWSDEDQLGREFPEDATLSDWLLHQTITKGHDLENAVLAWRIAVFVHDIDIGEIDVAKTIEDVKKTLATHGNDEDEGAA